MMRKAVAEQAAADDVSMPDKSFEKRFPNVSMYLADPLWDDGTPRERSSLAISVDDGQVRIALNDKDGRQSAYTNAGSVEDALKLLEAGLVKGLVSWRPWDRKRGKGK